MKYTNVSRLMLVTLLSTGIFSEKALGMTDQNSSPSNGTESNKRKAPDAANDLAIAQELAKKQRLDDEGRSLAEALSNDSDNEFDQVQVGPGKNSEMNKHLCKIAILEYMHWGSSNDKLGAKKLAQIEKCLQDPAVHTWLITKIVNPRSALYKLLYLSTVSQKREQILALLFKQQQQQMRIDAVHAPIAQQSPIAQQAMPLLRQGFEGQAAPAAHHPPVFPFPQPPVHYLPFPPVQSPVARPVPIRPIQLLTSPVHNQHQSAFSGARTLPTISIAPVPLPVAQPTHVPAAIQAITVATTSSSLPQQQGLQEQASSSSLLRPCSDPVIPSAEHGEVYRGTKGYEGHASAAPLLSPSTGKAAFTNQLKALIAKMSLDDYVVSPDDIARAHSLLKSGANINSRAGCYNATLLHIAAVRNLPNFAQELLALGIDMTLRNSDNTNSSGGRDAVQLAQSFGNHDLAILLANHAAKTEKAKRQHNRELTEFLMNEIERLSKKGALLDAHTRDNIKRLLEGGANINVKGPFPHATTLLHLAIAHNASQDQEILAFIEYLLDNGANVKATNAYKQTPLYFAKAQPKTLEMLGQQCESMGLSELAQLAQSDHDDDDDACPSKLEERSRDDDATESESDDDVPSKPTLINEDIEERYIELCNENPMFGCVKIMKALNEKYGIILSHSRSQRMFESLVKRKLITWTKRCYAQTTKLNNNNNNNNNASLAQLAQADHNDDDDDLPLISSTAPLQQEQSKDCATNPQNTPTMSAEDLEAKYIDLCNENPTFGYRRIMKALNEKYGTNTITQFKSQSMFESLVARKLITWAGPRAQTTSVNDDKIAE